MIGFTKSICSIEACFMSAGRTSFIKNSLHCFVKKCSLYMKMDIEEIVWGITAWAYVGKGRDKW